MNYGETGDIGYSIGQAAFSAAMAAASNVGINAIGSLYGHALGNIGTELLRAGTHGLLQGGLQSLKGGKFGTGFITGAVSSLVGSGTQALGFGPSGLTAMTTIAGGVSAYLSEGDWLEGAMTGMSIGALNHGWKFDKYGAYYELDDFVCTAPSLGFMSNVHTALDVVGMIPGAELADLLNAGIFLCEGNLGDAGISMAATIPFMGNFATGAKLAKNGTRFIKSDMKYGREVHKLYHSNDALNKRGIKEFRKYPGIRPDYVDFKTRTIYELKPYNPRGIKTGTKQLEHYKEIFQIHTREEWNTVLDFYY